MDPNHQTQILSFFYSVLHDLSSLQRVSTAL